MSLLSSEYKMKLLKLKEMNSLITQFYPQNAYSIVNFDYKITKENKIQNLPNLSRDFESTKIFTNKIDFDVDYFYQLMTKSLLNESRRYLKLNVEKLLNLFDRRHVYKCNSSVDRVKKMFFDNKLTYSVFTNFMKLFEILELYDNPYYKTKKLNRPSNQEIYYVQMKTVVYQGKSEEEELIQMIKVFVELLNSIDSNKYSLVINLICSKFDF